MKLNIKYLVAMLFAAFIVQSGLAAFPAALPGFKSKEELAKTAQRLRPAKTTVEVQEASFYTGKPYEKAREGYLFKYRNYDPFTNRWSSIDPSGYPDGPNNIIYAACPTSELDPDGRRTLSSEHLSHEVTVSFTPQNSSGNDVFTMEVVNPSPETHPLTPEAELNVNFSASAAGCVVQHITVDYTGVFFEDGTPWTDFQGKTGYDYYEAWSLSSFGNDPGNTDTYGFSFQEGTYGTAVATGFVNFFQSPEGGWGEGNEDPRNWQRGYENPLTAPAGYAYATTNAPSWWSDDGNWNHNMSMTWE